LVKGLDENALIAPIANGYLGLKNKIDNKVQVRFGSSGNITSNCSFSKCNCAAVAIAQIQIAEKSDGENPNMPNEESFPTTLILALAASVAIVGIGLLVYFKKRKHDGMS
jgi:hypothetical protein